MCTAFFPLPEKERKKERKKNTQKDRQKERVREGVWSSEFFHAPESIRKKELKIFFFKSQGHFPENGVIRTLDLGGGVSR